MSDKARARRAYEHEPMTRAEADDVIVEVGLALKTYPVYSEAIGAGFAAVLPVEALRAYRHLTLDEGYRRGRAEGYERGHAQGLDDAGKLSR